MAGLEAHAERIVELVTEFERLPPDDPVRVQVLELLAHVDYLHRSCIAHLHALLGQLGGAGLVSRLAADPTVRLLFALYDLADPATLPPLPVVEPGAAFIPLAQVGSRVRTWRDALRTDDLPREGLRGLEIDGVPVLLCVVGDRILAYRNACGRSILPLHLGERQGEIVRCPWHACRYDLGTGKRVDREGPPLEPFTVAEQDGVVRVALPAPRRTFPPGATRG